MRLSLKREKGRGELAFTLIEVVVSSLVAGAVFAGILTAYIQAARFAEWSGYSLAAQALSIQQLEQARSAKWDTQSVPELDETVDIPSVTWTELDVPRSGDNAVLATNYISMTNLTIATGRFKMIRVDTVWTFRQESFTNSVATFIAPDR
jgi:type II secretory pathway pseudopilin PulG